MNTSQATKTSFTFSLKHEWKDLVCGNEGLKCGCEFSGLKSKNLYGEDYTWLLGGSCVVSWL